MPVAQTLADAVDSVSRFVRTLDGWKQLLFTLICGAISAIAFPPLVFTPALLIGFAMLVLMLDGAQWHMKPISVAERAAWFLFGGVLAAFLPDRLLRAFRIGWFFGLGQFAVGLHWVGYAFLVDPSEHLWQLPIGVAGLAMLLAVFPAWGAAAAAWLWRSGPLRIPIFAMCYAMAEWLRGHVLTGFPWNLPGYGWGMFLQIFQSTALFGIYGLTFLTVLFGASLAALFDTEHRTRWLFPAGMLGLFVIMWSAGSLRQTFTPIGSVPDVSLRIVQPNIPQNEKYLPQYVARNWDRLIDLSNAKGPKPTITIWPESAPPFLLQREPEAVDQISLLTRGKAVLITGAVRSEQLSDGSHRYFNSLFIFGHAAQLIAVYDKFHLVPFGEYLPMEPLLSAIGLTKLVGIGSFASGPGPRTFHIPGAPPVGPLICYEIIFPGAVIGQTRPGWLVNVSDDSWFGPWAGPRQHLLIARVRAIEEGLPVVRGTNTGFSAVIDPLGRLASRLGSGRMGVLDAQLPQALPPTPYARFGDLIFAFMIVVCGAVTLYLRRYF